jgi:uncharacterized protein YjlB
LVGLDGLLIAQRVHAATEDHKRALTTIPKVGRPRKDPVYGTKGPLLRALDAVS